jgi:Capsule polysaccharide biosynthesis protein
LRSVEKKILCLINSAAYSRPYFEQLAPFLVERGCSVVFAIDSHLSDVLYAKNQALTNARYFTDFVRNHSGAVVGSRRSHSNSWSSLLSDFDRFTTMDIRPPLGVDSKLAYGHVPEMLDEFFAGIFETERPDAVLYEQVSNSFAIAAYRASVKAGVPFCSLCPSRIGGRIEISMTGAFQDHRTVGDIYAGAKLGSISAESYRIAREYVQTIDTQVPDYMKGNAAGQALSQMSLRRKYLSARKIMHFLRGWRYRRAYPDDCREAYQHGDPVRMSLAFAKRAFWRRLRTHVVSRYYRNDPGDVPYILYPLHSHPEASTSVLAPDFIDEMSVIRSVAFRLPTDTLLCVKEHPSAVASQPTSFYRQLAVLPNVRLLGAQLSAKELIRGSLGVVCVTSTLGFEAAVLNKPVIALGDVLYGYYPNVRMASEFSALDGALEWMLNYVPLSPDTLVDATAAYVEFGIPGSFDFFESLGNVPALRGVAEALLQRLDSKETWRVR